MRNGWKQCISLTIWLAGLPVSAAPAGIRVRLHVYAPVPAATLSEAKEVASFLLAKANVRLLWGDCAIKEDQPSNDPICHLRITPRDLQLHILDRQMAKRANKRSRCMGYAVLTNGQGSFASVFHHKAEELASLRIATLGSILGGMIAHEIGHLLGIRQHSRQGLMRASWDDQDMRALAKGLHLLRRDQEVLVAARAASRIAAEE